MSVYSTNSPAELAVNHGQEYSPFQDTLLGFCCHACPFVAARRNDIIQLYFSTVYPASESTSCLCECSADETQVPERKLLLPRGN